jgi:hypothetical protein
MGALHFLLRGQQEDESERPKKFDRYPTSRILIELVIPAKAGIQSI